MGVVEEAVVECVYIPSGYVCSTRTLYYYVDGRQYDSYNVKYKREKNSTHRREIDMLFVEMPNICSFLCIVIVSISISCIITSLNNISKIATTNIIFFSSFVRFFRITRVVVTNWKSP